MIPALNNEHGFLPERPLILFLQIQILSKSWRSPSFLAILTLLTNKPHFINDSGFDISQDDIELYRRDHTLNRGLESLQVAMKLFLKDELGRWLFGQEMSGQKWRKLEIFWQRHFG